MHHCTKFCRPGDQTCWICATKHSYCNEFHDNDLEEPNTSGPN